MIFDENALGKSVLGMIPATVAANANTAAGALAIDTAGYESCTLTIVVVGTAATDLGNFDATTGVPLTLTGSNSLSTGYVPITDADVVTTDATYASSAWKLTVDATAVTGDVALGYLVARLGIVSKYRYIKASITHPAGAQTLDHVSIVAELGRPRYSTDFLAYNVVPSQA